MSANSSSDQFVRKFFAALAITAMLFGSVPFSVYAQESGDAPTEENIGDNGESTGDGEDGGDTGDAGDGAGAEEGGEDGTAGEVIPTTSENNVEGGNGEGASGDEGTTGEEGDAGDEGAGGGGGEGGNTAEEIPGEDITGQQTEVGTTTTSIETGNATATGEIQTTANSNNIRSTTTTPIGDIDTYTLTATSTNDGTIDNTGTTTAVTGENLASTTETVQIVTGDAVSVLNIANVLNTNIINSDGFMYLLNQMLGSSDSLDLRNLFFSDPASLLASNYCSLMSCAAEDVVYNLLQQNIANISNDVNIAAITGANEAYGRYAGISTGDAYGAANIINVANTNIIDSNYILMAVNGIGTLNGDLVLPTAELWHAFFGRPNGMTALEDVDDAKLIDVNNINYAEVNTELNTVAESGANQATTTLAESYIKTGMAEAASNVLNKVNQNFFGGDSLYMLIRIHGVWNGNVYGLPDGLSWEWTPDGIVIYNSDAEISPSQLLYCGTKSNGNPKLCDVDSYTADLANHSTTTINNKVNILSLTGKNMMEATYGAIETGNAFAGANVMNIANTNVIGRNWVMAILNIFGDFNGDVSFGRPDLWVGGQLVSDDEPAGPGTRVTYTYTIRNDGDLKASNVEFSHSFNSEYMYHYVNGLAANNLETASLGTILPGESKVVTFEAIIDPALPGGTTAIIANAHVDSDEPDNNYSDNSEELTLEAINSSGGSGNGGGSEQEEENENDAGQSSEDGDNTEEEGNTNEDETENTNTEGTEENNTPAPAPTGGGGGGPSGGGGKSSNKDTGQVLGTSIEREKLNVDPNSAPDIRLYKTANIKQNSTIKAGQSVDYKVTVKNRGGKAYDAIVYDTLLNPIGSKVSGQDWKLGTIEAGEVIELTYTIKYREDTPTGIYKNTASMVAYKEANAKGDKSKQLKIKDAVFRLNIKGVDLAIRNVGILSTYPLGDGLYGALVAWETSRPTDGQVFFGPKDGASNFDPAALNLGYERASFRMPFLTTRHFIFINNLKGGTEYSYHIRSVGDGKVSLGGDYTFATPGYVASTLSPSVAGASTQNTAPAPKATYTPPPVPKPQLAPEPESAPEPEPAPNNNSGTAVGGFVKKVFGWFR